jgi:DNA-directed RNA polymerase specialized sigma24 family protein
MRLYSNRKAGLETLPKLLVRATSARRPREWSAPRHTQVRLNPDQAKELAAAYRAGRTIRELAQRYGVHRTTVSTMLRRFDVELRQRGLVASDVTTAAGLY